tara:strand:+ start:7751 stop:12004 length:4254 start_codon:yes stop_codon:yes gene_type:complete
MIREYRTPKFTSITSLVDAPSTGAGTLAAPQFNLAWGTVDNLVKYKIYRHIERKYPSSLANGGTLVDSTNPSLPDYANQPVYKLITETTGTSYSDTLDDLSDHADEGIILSSGVWRDDNGSGANVIDEILNTDRRLMYKIVAVTDDVPFNRTPFIYTCQEGGVQCRSVIAQVRWNTRYNEGDVVWYNPITGRNRTSVDITFDPTVSRFHNVWVSGNDRVIYALNGATGDIVKSFEIPNSLVTYVVGIRVDPATGNGIVIGDNDQVYTCNISSGTIVTTVKTNASYLPNGNKGLVLTDEADAKYAYVVANSDVVSKCDYSGSVDKATTVIPRTDLGCASATPIPSSNYKLENVLGIANGPDQSVWVNNHVPIFYSYQYTTQNVYYTGQWIGYCVGPPAGTPTPASAAYWARQPEGVGLCEKSKPTHYVSTRHVTNVVTTIETNFLQDIGYITGVGAANLGAANWNTDLADLDASTFFPYTASAGRTGWLGKSPDEADNTGRPYIEQAAPIPDPATSPLPAISQKGMTADIPETADDNVYNVFQVNESEGRVHRLEWDNTNLTYSVEYVNNDYEYNRWWDIDSPVHCITDSQNNVWVLQDDPTNQMTLIYQLPDTGTFPYGGTSTWPDLTAFDSYSDPIGYSFGENNSDRDIEYALSRNTLGSLSTATRTDGYYQGYGIIIDGVDEGTQRALAKAWLATNWAETGMEIYPNYPTGGGAGYRYTASFPRVGGTTRAVPSEYNSDNTGIGYIFTDSSAESNPAYINPTVTYPNIDLKIFPVESSPFNCDDTFWTDQKVANSDNTAASGYDDFTATLSATLIDQGSFYFYGYDWYFDDKAVDLDSTDTNPTTINTVANTYDYTYHDPSLNGKPYERTQGGVAEADGIYNPFVVGNTNTNAYTVSGDTVAHYASSNTVDSTVWERWPTARFYVTPYDTASLRQGYLSTWNLTEFAYPVGDNGEDLNSDARIVSGYDPLSANFTDTSISRTWPLSDWFWTFGDGDEYLGFALDNNRFSPDVTYSHILTTLLHESDPASIRDDCTTEHPNMTAHLYKGPGTYEATLYVRASNTNTDSWNISAGITDQATMSSEFVVAATRQINVLEVCPAIAYDLSGNPMTITNDYSDDLGPLSDHYTVATVNPSSTYSPDGILSGYAPYLQVSVSGILTSRSLPISAAVWDFGDAYVNSITNDEVTLYDPAITGWPEWSGSDPYETTGRHTYVMPGFYNITLRSVSSADQIDHVSNCTGLEKSMYVYVEEIDPIAGVSANVVSGSSPLTVDFTLSPYTTAGSFPICRIDWDFGDDTEILTLSRYNSSAYTAYESNAAYEASDPRNVIVSHEYNRTLTTISSIYVASVSVYACNTNTVATTSMEIGPIALETLSVNEGDIHLVESRMSHQNDDLLLVFEGETSSNNYSVLLSGIN